MDNYSQQHLKVAATEPEHVVRKAEFDLTVSVLDERIVAVEKTLDERIIGPAVLQTKTPVESVDATDSVVSPLPSPLSETFSIGDDAETKNPDIAVPNIAAETMGADDSVESPQASPLGESVSATDDVNGIVPSTKSRIAARNRLLQWIRSNLLHPKETRSCRKPQIFRAKSKSSSRTVTATSNHVKK